MEINRQYIGARYVPKFADPVEWSDTTAYGPLTIVTYLGSSYTSKKQTTPGILPTNSEYWALTGNYNGQVEGYREEVEKAVAATQEVQNNLDTQQQEFNTFKSDTSNNITNVSTQITQINQRLGRRFIFIGASYGVSPTEETGWINQAINFLGLTKGVNAFYKAVPGTGFYNGTFLQNLQSLESTITNKQTITDIVVVGGYNEINATDDADITTGAINFNTYARATYPNAKIWMGPCAVNSGDRTKQYRLYYTVFPRLNLTAALGWAIIQLESTMHNLLFIGADHIHPNQAGATQIATAVCSALNGGNTYFYRNIATWQPSEGVTASTTTPWQEQVTNNIVHLQTIAYPDITFTPKRYNGNRTFTQIATMVNSFLFGGVTGYSQLIPVLAGITYDGDETATELVTGGISITFPDHVVFLQLPITRGKDNVSVRLYNIGTGLYCPSN